ncbi:MAG: hypothetical protein ACLQU1_07800 [Bryobacteraceae bacterium]
MRAGPLSSSDVIVTLNRYFVPVVSSNYETVGEGSAPAPEKQERQRIYLDFAARKLGIGDVHIYILRPDLSSMRGMDIGTATQEGKLAAFLEDVRQELLTPVGPPAFPPQVWSSAPPAPADSMIFHIAARGEGHGSWREFPSENWIVLSRGEWSALLPPEPVVARHSSWQIPRAVSDKLLTWFYPQTEEVSQKTRSRIDEGDLRMTVTALENGVARARIEGSLKLLHSFYPGKPHDDFVNAQLVGFMDFVPGEGRIQRLRLIAAKATYNTEPFGAALRSVSRETLEAQQ